VALIFLRHTTPDVPKGICYGMTDLPLTASFETEFATLLPKLPKVERIVCSPLQRCRLLAKRVSRAFDLPFSIKQNLREMDFGTWEMTPWDTVPRAELDAWAADFMDARPHGGESVSDLESRVQGALQGLASDTLVVTHSGVIRAASVLSGHPKGWNLDVAYGGWIEMSL